MSCDDKWLNEARANWRVAWVRWHYPDVMIIHVDREPRDVWRSMHSYGDVDALTHDDYVSATNVLYYLMLLANDLGLRQEATPAALFDSVWQFSVEALAGCTDTVWRYEEAVRDFSSWAQEPLVDAGLLADVSEQSIHRRGDAVTDKSLSDGQNGLEAHLDMDWQVPLLGRYFERKRELLKSHLHGLRRVQAHPVSSRVYRFYLARINARH